MTNRITKKRLWIDERQGIDAAGRCFGFIGVDGVDEYCGWFFSWPRSAPDELTDEELRDMIESLEIDQTCRRDPIIPRRWAESVLRARMTGVWRPAVVEVE